MRNSGMLSLKLGAPASRLGVGRLSLGRLDAAFLRRLVVTGVGNAVGRALGLLFALVAAALFLPEDYGYIRWALSVGMLAAIPAAAGPAGLARALGALRDDPASQRSLAAVGVAAIAAATAGCALATALVLGLLGRPIGGVLAVVVGTTLFTTCFNIYRGLGSSWRMAAMHVGNNLLSLLLMLLVCGALGLAVPDLVLVFYGFSWLLVVPLLGLGVGRPDTVDARRALGEVWRVWGPMILAYAAFTAWTWGDVVLVEHFLGTAAAGAYGLARTFVTVFLLVPEAVTMLLVPHVAAEGRRAAGLTRGLLGLTALVSLALLGGMLLVVPHALELLGGGRYATAGVVLPWLAVGMAIYALYVVLEGHLVGMGRAGAHAVAVVVMAATSLGGAALLLPGHGLPGAGWAFVVGTLVGLATLALLGFRPWARAAEA